MPRTPEAKDLTLVMKAEIALFLAEQAASDKLPHGAITAAADRFGHHRNTIAKVWRNRANLGASRRSNSGPPKRYDDEYIKAAVEAAPLEDRTTLSGLAPATGVGRTTLARRLAANSAIRRVTSVPKPLLTPEQMANRRAFARSHVKALPGGLGFRFDSMMDVVHVDEKWFYVHPARRTYYLSVDEPVPHKTTKNKRHVTKVMFLVAIARPRTDPHTKKEFDGKIGLWPVVEKTFAVRNSKNRPAGTELTTPIEMSKNIYERMLIQQVLPAIKNVWPGNKKVIVQQDNASPHLASSREAGKAAAKTDGWDISFVNQPARSPDYNILDLGLFNSMQSLQYRKRTHDIEGLIKAVEEAYDEMDAVTSNKCFLTLQSVMEASMLVGGGNSYTIPHLRKDALIRLGVLPVSLPCSIEAFNASLRE